MDFFVCYITLTGAKQIFALVSHQHDIPQSEYVKTLLRELVQMLSFAIHHPSSSPVTNSNIFSLLINKPATGTF